MDSGRQRAMPGASACLPCSACQANGILNSRAKSPSGQTISFGCNQVANNGCRVSLPHCWASQQWHPESSLPIPPRVVEILLRIDFNIPAVDVDVGELLALLDHLLKQMNQVRFLELPRFAK